MTVVDFNFSDEIAAAGFEPSGAGHLICRYVNDFDVDDIVVTTKPFRVAIASDGTGSADVYPTPAGNGLMVRVPFGSSLRGIRPRTVEVPDSPTPVDFSDLVELDPKTLATPQLADAIAQALAGKVSTSRTVNGHPLSGDVTVSKSDVGLALAENTSDMGKPVSTAQAAALEPRVKTPALPIYVYGNSYTVIPPPVSASDSYLTRIKDALEAPSLTTYGLGGRRIFDMAWNMVNEFNAPGTLAPVAGSKWPGEARKGLVIFDTMMNDIAHGPTSGNVPTAISGTNYREGVKAAYRAALAMASMGSGIEQDAFIQPTDSWTNLPAGWYSGGSVYYTTTVGRRLTYSVTPPQRGPLAGKVFLLTYTLGATTYPAGNAIINVSVDGGSAVPFARFPWEEYTGHAASAITHIPTVIPVTVPIDGNAHTAMKTHAGSAGQFAHADRCIVPSETPSNILVLQSPAPVANAGGWTAAQVAIWKANAALLEADVQSVIAEFPNAYWVPTTMTANGLWSLDGIHYNDRGKLQRANDVLEFIKTRQLRSTLASQAWAAQADSNFAIV